VVTRDRSPGLLSVSDVSLPDPGARCVPGSSAVAWVGPAGPIVPPAAVLVADLPSKLQVCADEIDGRSGQQRGVGAGILIGLDWVPGPRMVDAWPVKHAVWRAPPSRHVLRAVMRTRHRNRLLPLLSGVASIMHSHLVARSRAIQARRAGGGRPGGRATRAVDAPGLSGLVRVRLPGLGGQLSLTNARPATGGAGAIAAAEHARSRVVVPKGGASISLLRRMRHDA
jgi:hypothetical protein